MAGNVGYCSIIDGQLTSMIYMDVTHKLGALAASLTAHLTVKIQLIRKQRTELRQMKYRLSA